MSDFSKGIARELIFDDSKSNINKREVYINHAYHVSYLMNVKSKIDSFKKGFCDIINFFDPDPDYYPATVQSALGGAFLRMYLNHQIDKSLIQEAGREMKAHKTFSALEKGLQANLSKYFWTNPFSDKQMLLRSDQYLQNQQKKGIYFRDGLNPIVGGLTDIQATKVDIKQLESTKHLTIRYEIHVKFSDSYDFDNKREGEFEKYRIRLAKLLKNEKFEKFETQYLSEAAKDKPSITHAGVFAAYMYALEKAGYTPGPLKWNVVLPMSGTLMVPNKNSKYSAKTVIGKKDE